MKMKWMEILESHPNNMFAEAHQSGRGIIELVEPLCPNLDHWGISFSS